jgi:stearoyl-CoA desaturase (delta-9 desaturase)
MLTTPKPTEIRLDSHDAPRVSLSQRYFNWLGIGLIHAFTIVALARGASAELVLLAAATYFVRMFAITGAYHRYFAHRSYKTGRVFQFLLALLGTTATQKGPLWWASTHRVHHKESDTEKDVHSPMRRGFWYSHAGWWLSPGHEIAPMHLIPDYASYPELRWLDKHHYVGPALLMALTGGLFGLDGLLWGYVLSTCVLMHATFTINSLSHIYGTRRYATTDTSRNNPYLAILTMGEGWHNNHHHYMNSANQGFFWWEVDITYYLLKGLEKVGLVWDLRKPPAHVLAKNLLAEVGERAPLLLADKAPASDPAPLAARSAPGEV